ncbi:MAG: hypothetical protein AAFX06_19990 [Planctomycetota bacterium]
MALKTKSCLSWFGSDASVAPQLAELLNGCKHVAIPFTGGASIIPHLTARAIVCNDLQSDAINFYRVASGVHGEKSQRDLFALCERTLSHPEELERAWTVLETGLTVDRAWAYWAVCWLGRKGKGGTDDGIKLPSVRWTANGGTNASRIKAASADLKTWATHFERCEFQCLDFREFAGKLKDQPDCGSYWDSPWPKAGDRYEHKFTERDHRDMAAIVSEFEEHRVLIRNGDHPLIRELYPADRWHIIEASSRTQANTNVGELWITNFEPNHGGASLPDSNGNE